MDISGILQVVSNSKLIYPEEEKVRSTSIGSSEAFHELLKQSQEDPAKFWDRAARELVWYEPWDEIISGQLPD
ncbi:MAG: acetyl-coenzyme A synthetase N-terminal domain-containing protein, partial [Bacillus sp. (in: firmicutes)]